MKPAEGRMKKFIGPPRAKFVSAFLIHPSAFA
jgi:hypothetical protein